MSYEEFTKWQIYFNLRPIDWRDDTRIMKILQCLGVKESGDKIFESLYLLKKDGNARTERNAMMASLKGSVMFRHLMGAVGGDKVPVLDTL